MRILGNRTYLMGIIISFLICFVFETFGKNPRVFVFTDININAGDPDDRQSLVHMFWYSDELNIEGIVPERWNAYGIEACVMAVKAYETDYNKYGFNEKGYANPDKLRNLIAKDFNDAKKRFRIAAVEGDTPLYVLI